MVVIIGYLIISEPQGLVELYYFDISFVDWSNLLTFFSVLKLSYISFNSKIKFPHSSFECMSYLEDQFKFLLN